jgi:hypothetical protein
MRHLVFAFIRTQDWTTLLNKVLLTEIGKGRVRTLYEDLIASSVIIDPKSVKIFAEDFREDARLHSEEIANHLGLPIEGDESSITTFTSGYRGVRAEIESVENAKFDTLIFYVVRDGSTFHEIIRYWNENASLFGYSSELYPTPDGLPLALSIEIRSNPILWTFEKRPKPTAG